MVPCWQLLTEQPQERADFASWQHAAQWPSAAVGPRNRLRGVVRIESPSGTFYGKTFLATQWKNRLRMRFTAPRASDDAERELRMTQALLANGYAAPRPIAYGRDQHAYYLCAALPGRSVRELLRDGACSQELARRVAEHCGGLLAQGFWLPDLSAEHVFVHGEQPLAVLDLHNGTLHQAGPAPRWLCRRVLKHFAKSVQGCAMTNHQRLTFAVRLLHAAGAMSHARAILRALPMLDTAARYERPGKATAYKTRNRQRHARELHLLAQVFPGGAGETWLDLPCGTGRLCDWLAARGCQPIAADRAFAMLQQVVGPPKVQADALQWPFADAAVDGVLMFRFLHHLPTPLANQAIQEACRVARRFLTLTFFHPCSAHHLARRCAGNRTRHARTLGSIVRICQAHGFRLVTSRAELPYLKDLWLATFVRDR